MTGSHLIDGYLAPTLVPAIMGTMVFKLAKANQSDLFYCTVAFGTILSAIISLLQLRIRTFTRSRNKMTFLTAILLTISSLMAIIGFSYIRINIPSTKLPYKLPIMIRNQIKSTGSDVFRHHFFADFVPGFILILQAQLCTTIQYELLYRAKRSFSMGESSIISQLASACFSTWAMTIYSQMTQAGPFKVSLTNEIVLNIGMIMFVMVVLPFYFAMNSRTTTFKRYALLMLAISYSYIKAQQIISTKYETAEPIRWLANYIFATHQRISLFSLWLSTLTACVSFSTTWSRLVGSTNSLVRKTFHLAIGVVFVSGCNQDLEFTRFASGGILIVLLLMEIARACRLPPIGDRLEQVCRSLRGKWDNKYLTVSHIYLLMGAFVPLWILPNNSRVTNKLLLSSGLISVGVGDTAAAVIGTLIGKTKFKGKTDKTLEGLGGNIICMIIFKAYWIGYTDFLEEFSFFIAAILTGLVEAMSNNCDNLILPLVMILYMELF